MIKAATVGVNDHKTHRAKPGVSSRNLINKAAPTDMHSTRTEKMAALFVSVSFVNISRTPSLAEEPARRSCLAAGSRSGSDPRSRRRAGSGLALSRDVRVPRNEYTILLSEGNVCAPGHQVG